VTVAELPIGIITALVGLPVFAVILRRMQSRSGWAHD
jgi:iron complex transport system permease protein